MKIILYKKSPTLTEVTIKKLDFYWGCREIDSPEQRKKKAYKEFMLYAIGRNRINTTVFFMVKSRNLKKTEQKAA